MAAAERDEALRYACFAHLRLLEAAHGPELPLAALAPGFPFRGAAVKYLNPQKGIHRSRHQRGRAALSLMTSFNSPYDDQVVPEGFIYAYRAGSAEQSDNRALRAAWALQVPLVYFVAVQPGVYRAEYPVFVAEDDVGARSVLLGPGAFIGAVDEPEAAPVADPIARRYAVRETRIRLHQARFRGRVLPAYRRQCAVCRLKEIRLLDAAHIVPDPEPQGEAAVSNGLSLCTIHHRAFDHDLVGIDADFRVHIAPRLLYDEDGPMLDLLKGAEGTAIVLPRAAASRPDRKRLAERFQRFVAAA